MAVNREDTGKYQVEQGPRHLADCGKKEVIDGKMAQVKGNVWVWLCFIAYMKVRVPYPYHWGGSSLLAAITPSIERAVCANTPLLPTFVSVYLNSATQRQKKYLWSTLFLLIPLLLVGNPAPCHPLAFADRPGKRGGAGRQRQKLAPRFFFPCPPHCSDKKAICLACPAMFEDSGKRAC